MFASCAGASLFFAYKISQSWEAQKQIWNELNQRDYALTIICGISATIGANLFVLGAIFQGEISLMAIFSGSRCPTCAVLIQWKAFGNSNSKVEALSNEDNFIFADSVKPKII